MRKLNPSTHRDPAIGSTISSGSLTRAKTAIRKKIIEERKLLDDVQRREKSFSITQRLFELDEFKKSKRVFCFLSLPHEVHADAIICESFRLDKEVFVPFVNNKRGILQVARIPSLNAEFVISEYGVREPAPQIREIVSPSCIDFVVAPGLAFDVYGNRIGYGGGYYDKLFKGLSRDVIQVGVGYDFQVLDSVPHSDLDESVHVVITETKTLRCRSV